MEIQSSYRNFDLIEYLEYEIKYINIINKYMLLIMLQLGKLKILM